MTDTPTRIPPDMPGRMRQLPRDSVGRPIPFFSAVVDGAHDFRVMDPDRLAEAIVHRLCFVCGQRLNVVSATFVVGPMCVINHVSGEPPNHRDCAEWSAKACPFLSKPAKARRESHLPENVVVSDYAIARNPGVTALVDARRWAVERQPSGSGLVIRFGDIRSVTWWAEGRLATRSEVMASIETGLPVLEALAREDGDAAIRALRLQVSNAGRWLP